MSGTLYLVATPIGNLADMTHRAVEVLKSVDYILAEDTRTSLRVLQHYDIDTPFYSSIYQGAERQRIPSILTLLESGKNLALISDAGTPLISDPGFPLVRAAVEADHPIVPVPGPCAAITGLIAAGLPLNRFSFEGMLPRGRGARKTTFDALRNQTRTSVFYESSHRIADTLEVLAESLPTRQIVLARELTKLHEEFLRGTASELLSLLSNGEHTKGEFVLIVEGTSTETTTETELLTKLLDALKAENLPSKTIARVLTQVVGLPRNEAYRLVHGKSDDEQ